MKNHPQEKCVADVSLKTNYFDPISVHKFEQVPEKMAPSLFTVSIN